MDGTVTAPPLWVGAACSRYGDAHISQGLWRSSNIAKRRRHAHPLDVKACEVVLFGKYTSQEIEFDGEGYLRLFNSGEKRLHDSLMSVVLHE